MKRKLGVIVSVVLLFVTGIATVALAEQKDTVSEINQGIFIGSLDVSAMTSKEARAAVKEYIQEVSEQEVTLNIDGNIVTTTAGKLGYQWVNTSVVKEAVGLGKHGNVIKRYKDKKDLANKNQVLEIECGIDDSVAKKGLKSACKKYNNPAKNATLTRENGEFVITKEEQGHVIDMDTTIGNLKTQLIENWNGADDIEVTVAMKEEKPALTYADCEKVKDVLGTYSTTFTSGQVNRNQNIYNGAVKLDGILLAPGESLSCNSKLVPWTEENGWSAAGTYVNGQVEDSLGGGICQVSSTLYNALLLAELEIVERYPHSMAVGYVDLAADAALADDIKDLVFKNNTEAPVYIESDYVEGKVTFTVYGEETRPENRTIEYVSETISTTESTVEEKKDKNQPKGYEEIIEKGHTGYVAKLWKHIYEDGKEVSVELVNTSTYRMTPTKKVIGTGKKKDDKKDDEKDDKKDDKKNETTVKETTKKKEPKTTTKKSNDEHEPASEAETTTPAQEENNTDGA